MRRWWKLWALLTSGLLGLGDLLPAARAQYPMPPTPPMPFAADPQYGAQPPPPPAKQDAGNPFSLRNDGSPNAFNDPEGQPPPQENYLITLRGEYLNWHVQQGRLATALVNSSNSPNLTTDRGAFGQPNTTTLLGAGNYSYDRLPGARGTIGLAFPRFCPIEVTGFALNGSKDLFAFSGNGDIGSRVIARPLQLVDIPVQLGLPTQDVSLVNFPGVVAGSLQITSHINLWGLESNIVIPCCDNDCLGLAFLVGYRHADLSESLDMLSQTTPVGGTALNFAGDPNGFVAPARIFVSDVFKTRNMFDGGQLGIRTSLTAWRLTLSSDLKLAMGNTHQTLNVYGQSTIITPNGSVSLPGGLLALPSNSTMQNQSRFSIIPEVNLNLRCRICANLNVLVGYNVFYWTNVARAGDHVRSAVNSQEIPTDINFVPGFSPGRQPIPIQNTSFLAHGINVGLEIGF